MRQAILSLSILVVFGCVAQPEPPEGEAGWTAVELGDAELQRDSDQDGLVDGREQQLETDPQNPDTDGDGFQDGFESLFGQFGFDPLAAADADSDGDGLTDALEARLGSSPIDIDTDADRWGDFDEFLNRRYGFDLLSPTADTDFDGLADDLERGLGSALDLVDSNDDGITDFQAFHAGADPTVVIDFNVAELIGITYSQAMGSAILEGQAGRSVPVEIAVELPYAQVTAPPVTDGLVDPSAALMQRAAYNPSASPAFYRPYAEIVTDLFSIADHFDGSPGPAIVRLFVWSAPTVDCCAAESRNVPGRRLYLVKISDNPELNEDEAEVALMGMHHARELITVTITIELLRKLTSDYEAGEAAARHIVDGTEIWLLVVVNPNGYERALGAQLDWRKNTRRVSATQIEVGVDLNRNYSYGHATLLTAAERAALSFNARFSNGITASGGFDEDSYQFPNTTPFSEVETQAVRGLALSHFLTQLREEVAGLDCSISWHSFTGLVGHPLGHDPIPPGTDITAADRVTLGMLADELANPAGYTNARDTFRMTHYPVFGDSEDWLHKDRGAFSTFVESYSIAEGRIGNSYYPADPAEAMAVAAHNYAGALEMMRHCPH